MVLYLHDDLSTDPDYVVDRIVYAVRRRQSLLVRTHATPHNADIMMRARGFESIVPCTNQEHPRAPQPACVRAEAQPGPLLLAGACHNSLGSSERKGDELLPMWWWCWGFSRRC